VPGRVRTRRQFARLARPERKGRRGPIRVHFVEPSDPSEEFSVAYAIGKELGDAVDRNRLRRRLRVLMDEQRPSLRSGLYLIKCDFRAKDIAYDHLRDHLRGALADAGLLHGD
jgi:ribonuclease P protein component